MAADSSILPSLTQPHIVPKLEDFFADSSSLVHSQTETQDSSLTQIYDHNHHGSAYFNDQQDLKAIAGFQAFSTNSGSEVDDSTSMARTQFPAAEFACHSIESTGIELPFSNGSLSLGVNNNTTNINNGNKNQSRYENKAIVSADSDSTKKIAADTFGQRTSIYRGVTRYFFLLVCMKNLLSYQLRLHVCFVLFCYVLCGKDENVYRVIHPPVF